MLSLFSALKEKSMLAAHALGTFSKVGTEPGQWRTGEKSWNALSVGDGEAKSTRPEPVQRLSVRLPRRLYLLTASHVVITVIRMVEPSW